MPLTFPAAVYILCFVTSGACAWQLSRNNQRTRARQMANDNLAFVPTAQMLAGDFTDYASPACNAGRQVALRAPFVNNRINPALLSPAAIERIAQIDATDRWIGRYKAARLRAVSPGAVVNDYCCGVGGDLIALAREGASVVVTDRPLALLIQRGEARIYVPVTVG